ncbi:MAG: formylmethanofuran dehydrogenase [Chloroflexi bacterium]|nr:formylmethanofuran dehydrogenase [Chloroflexota bacterium]
MVTVQRTAGPAAAPSTTQSDAEWLTGVYARSAQRHERLCPRQVLGVRMGLAAAEALGVDPRASGKALYIFAETDGCFADGVEAATGCSMGHRNMRLMDYGRVAIVAVHIESGAAVRISPAPGVREAASAYAPDESRRYYQQLEGYQAMPDADLLRIRPVSLRVDLAALLGRKGLRVDCDRCGEEVLNGRQHLESGRPVCQGCTGGAFYSAMS